MSKVGWISLHRKLQDCWIWNDEPYSKGQAWVDLLLSATHDDFKKRIDNSFITIHSGQLHTSILKLSQRWQWSEKKVRRFLTLLESDEMITYEGNARGTTVTIVNYGFYQGEGRTNDLSNDPTEDEPTTQPRTSRRPTYNNINNINNNNNVNNNRGNFKPPTLEEVEDYCMERNNRIDAQSFIDFYSSKGWMIGKNKMKDWKAAIRTWERKDKPKSSNQRTIDWSAI